MDHSCENRIFIGKLWVLWPLRYPSPPPRQQDCVRVFLSGEAGKKCPAALPFIFAGCVCISAWALQFSLLGCFYNCMLHAFWLLFLLLRRCPWAEDTHLHHHDLWLPPGDVKSSNCAEQHPDGTWKCLNELLLQEPVQQVARAAYFEPFVNCTPQRGLKSKHMQSLVLTMYPFSNRWIGFPFAALRFWFTVVMCCLRAGAYRHKQEKTQFTTDRDVLWPHWPRLWVKFLIVSGRRRKTWMNWEGFTAGLRSSRGGSKTHRMRGKLPWPWGGEAPVPLIPLTKGYRDVMSVYVRPVLCITSMVLPWLHAPRILT